MSIHRMSGRPPLLAGLIRRLSVPIILGWLGMIAIVTFAVPSLEQVGRESSVSLVPQAAPSFRAMQRMGEVFGESNSDSVAMVVLEGQQPLDDEAHAYYDSLVRQLGADTTHVQHIQDYWGDPLTASGVQSGDGKSVYVQISLAGNQGQALANKSVEAVRSIVERSAPPPGVQAYVTGPAPLVTDMNDAGNSSIIKITAVTLVVIFTMLLFVYRSVMTVILLLIMVGIQVQAARGIVAFLGDQGVIGLSTFSVNLLVSLGIAVGTDYGIFFTGRYQEARQYGEDRETAFYTTYSGVAKVVVASGLTIAGAIFCLSFTRLPYFQTMGIPAAIGMAVAVAVAVTLVPAVISFGSRFGLFEPKRRMMVRRWRWIGTATVRWPGPILAAACAVGLVGLLALPGYQTSYDDRLYVPQDIPANVGYAAAQRHFPESRMTPDVMLLEADHDMRNPADFVVLHKLAKGLFAVPGISMVQSITRPEGSPIERTSIPFQISLQSAGMLQILPFGFDDFIRPLRNYLYWEKHCYDIPVCQALRSVFDTLDGVDEVSDKLSDLVANLDRLDELLPQMAEQFPVMIETMESTRKMMLSMHSTMSGIFDQMEQTTNNATAMGKAFDAAQNDDSFYLPPEVFENEDFKRVMDIFLSPDGKAARLLISQRGDPATREGISLVQPIETAAVEALKGTPLRNAKIYMTGTAASVKDIVDGSKYDLLIAATAALCLIFGIMLIMTRSFVAALVIVGTVALSLGAAFGLSVLIWQSILGIPLNWVVLAMSVIILLAVGSDYNLLLVSRMKEELGAGINTGIIRAMGGTGKVVTSAGLVFAFTMLSMVVSDLRVIGQVGSTIGIGLLFDTLVVRAFMTPSIAALLGRWFWWPQRIRRRPAITSQAPAERRMRVLLDA
ncbi:Probable membrane protein%2C MmpL [Mycobacteroides abscessus]|nr:Probable membrane protein%2C MmpL [Mycobacteroides abscessus]